MKFCLREGFKSNYLRYPSNKMLMQNNAKKTSIVLVDYICLKIECILYIYLYWNYALKPEVIGSGQDQDKYYLCSPLIFLLLNYINCVTWSHGIIDLKAYKFSLANNFLEADNKQRRNQEYWSWCWFRLNQRTKCRLMMITLRSKLDKFSRLSDLSSKSGLHFLGSPQFISLY